MHASQTDNNSTEPASTAPRGPASTSATAMSSGPTCDHSQNQTLSVNLDPLWAAVSDEAATRHIVGDDDGEHLMGALVAACRQAAPTTPIAPLAFSFTRTLANVPFRFLRVEVDDQGRAKTPITSLSSFNSQLGEHGALAKYFPFTSLDGNADENSLWWHASHPPAYSKDYPFSVDNFDCEQLVEDLEDDNDLLDRDVTNWVLWAAVTQTSTAPEAPAFACRDRIFSVDHLLQFLNDVRTSLNNIDPVPTIYFIVAVSYKGRYRNSDVSEMNNMMLAAPLHTTLSFFTNMVKRNGAGANQAPSSIGDEDEDDGESIHDTASSVGAFEAANGGGGGGTDAPVSNWSYSIDSSEGGGVTFTGNPVPFRTGVDSNGDTVFLGYEYDPFYGMSRVPAQSENVVVDEEAVLASSSSSSSTSEHAPTPPPPSILQSLDTNASKGDAVEGDLHALLPEAQSPEQAAWEQCCRLLCIDPEAHKDAQARSVKIPGTDNMWVKPSQLWTAYWMLTSRMDRGLCGGVLADVMGTGKTYVCLVVCLLRAYIGYNRAEVEREWQLREHEAKKGGASGGNVAPKQHLPRNEAGHASVACTCGNAMGIECYANPGGITRQIADSFSRGASLILAPQTVLDNWVKTVKHVRLQHKFFEPVVFHSKMSNEDVTMAPAPRLKQKLQMSVRPQAHVSSDGLFSQSWEPNVLDVVHDYQPSIAKDAYPERFIFLATHMPEKLTEFFQLPVPLRRKAGAGTRGRKTVYGCPVGIQLVDEFHKAKDDVIALALQHKHLQSGGGGSGGGDSATDNFDFWAITGTPLPAKLTDLEAVTNILQRLPQWDEPTSPHHGSRVAALRELQVAYEKAVAEDGTPEQAADFRRRAERFFQTGIIKRHTETSMFFGQRIFNLQDVTAQVVVHVTPAPLREDVSKVVARVAVKIRESMADGPSADVNAANWEQAVRSSSLFNNMMDLEILATFPGAAPLMLADPPVLDFGLAAIRAEIRKAKNHDVTKVELFHTHLDAIIHGSPHLQSILATLDEMETDRSKRRALPTPVAADAANRSVLAKKKADLSVKKLVVLCPRMAEAVFVFLALRKLRPEFNPVFLHADLKLSERTALLQDFNRLDAPTPAGVHHTARILVGTFRDAGTGNDLTVANYQILTGPLRLRSQQDQAFGRTNREGQTLPLHHRLLVTEDSPVDRIVVVTQARRHIVSDPFAMDEELELADVDQEEQ
ncbi:hypothetical protein HMPREF1624_04574 [Sporothrix schenckii ATCC 58251]|uniref:SNF2 N-terminal domain-containing protein n=1 Tax=Sporothrix schenckii (strain ATCC 58251 / de Perez 2211183) TaxID=1391915 RepID=U7PXC4_SPOS1|nr:hypothetical protein HMPREF1624_04574 [Sporothrix schenckii ATCC 58251]